MENYWLVWEPKDETGRAFPFPVFVPEIESPEGISVPQKNGKMVFKTKHLLEMEYEDFRHATGSKEFASLLVPNYLFYEDGEVLNDPVHLLCFWFNDKEMFIIEDLFTESVLKDDEGEIHHIFCVPVSGEGRVGDHCFNDDGNYDLKKMSMWPVIDLTTYGVDINVKI